TKIGKFGIGFVSVFACKPEAVLLHTGRDGEHWEVCFSADRSFVKGRLGEPVDGTQITVFVAGDRGRYGELVAQSRLTLKRWCAHSDIEVTFEDRSSMRDDAYEVINEPFAVPGECLTEATVEGTAIVAAYSDAPIYGFYNKGLALAISSDREQLLGGHADRFERIAFKVKSRYLEHTLSRDTVVQDANFQRVMRMIRELAAGQLLKSLVDELSALATAPTWEISDAERYLRLLAYLAGEPIADLAGHSDVPLLRTVDGAALALDGLWDAARSDGQIYLSDQPSELSAALAAQGTPVLFARRAVIGEGGRSDFGDLGNVLVAYLAQRSSTSLLGRARSVFGYDHWGAFAQMLRAPEEVFLAVEPAPDAEREAALIADADALLQEVGAGYRRLVPCRITTADRDAPLFVVAKAIQPLMAIPPPAAGSEGFRLRRPEAAVNVAHPQLRALLDLRALDRSMAAYCLAKDLLLVEDRKLDLDPALITAALPGHAQRYGKDARR
ncbi:MAG: hypothetical protein KC486_29795, partial [Myxococcales bacterium]|nr:hypothetical protein [Myxococcales bacterium]